VASSGWLASMFNKRMLICVFTGFASGLPFYVLIQLVPAWLREGGVSLADIGLFALLTMPYNWKFVWAPLLDRYAPPFLGRRRGWMLVFQLILLVAIGCLGWYQPAASTGTIAVLALIVAFFSASQDIVLDAYRREILRDEELGLGNSIHVQAYRLAGLVPGSMALILADMMPWSSVFWITGGFMAFGIALALIAEEPRSETPEGLSFARSMVEPFREYIQRRGWGGLALFLGFMFLYKLGDNMAVALATPFYLDMGFSMTEIGSVAKFAGLSAAIAGGLLGGIAMLKIGINRALWLFGMVQWVSIFGFALLVAVGPTLWMVISSVVE